MEPHSGRHTNPSIRIKKKERDADDSLSGAFKKKKDSIKSGMGEEEIYKPIWVFFDVMEAFLKGVYDCKSVISTEGLSNASVEQNIGSEDQREEDIENINPNESENNTGANDNIKIPVQRRRAVRPPELARAEKEMSNAFSTLNQLMLNKDKEHKTEDVCELYGRLLGQKLKDYSESERLEIMYEIDGMLLKRRLNRPMYVSSPSKIILRRPSSSASNYSSVSPRSPSPFFINPVDGASHYLVNPPDQNPSLSYNNRPSQQTYTIVNSGAQKPSLSYSNIPSQQTYTIVNSGAQNPSLSYSNIPSQQTYTIVNSPFQKPSPSYNISPSQQASAQNTYLSTEVPTIHVPDPEEPNNKTNILSDAYVRAMNS